jgi:hypothetical protein
MISAGSTLLKVVIDDAHDFRSFTSNLYSWPLTVTMNGALGVYIG